MQVLSSEPEMAKFALLELWPVTREVMGDLWFERVLSGDFGEGWPVSSTE
jgi:hypothetical protein